MTEIIAIEILNHSSVIRYVKHYFDVELTTDRYGALRYNGVHYNPQNLLEYFDLPYEIEARKREGTAGRAGSLEKH